MSACLVVGLGNPGAKYAHTRHNLGFWVVDRLIEQYRATTTEKFRAVFADITIGDTRVFLLKPQTYMNRSGESVGPAAHFFKIPPERVLVLTDDIDLPPGAVRIRREGGSGGHNGLKSVAQALGTEAFPRIRLGVGRSPLMAPDAYVLATVDAESRALLEETADRAARAVVCWAREGLSAAMNQFNRKGKSS
jgi:PTH1 family peptidyl-tRNA hydrolase